MTKKELARLRELVNKMVYHVEERVPGEREFLVVLRQAGRQLGRVDVNPGQWGIK